MGLRVRVIRGLVLFGLVLGGAFFGVCAASLTTAGHAVAQVASSIAVEGNRRVESDTIRSYFSLKPGERLDAAKVDEGIKALIATGLFSDARPTWSGGRVIITVVENQVIGWLVDLLGMPACKDTTASSISDSVASNHTSTELSRGVFEVDARPLTLRAVQSVVRDATSPHSQMTALTINASPSRFNRPVDGVSLD